MRSAVKYSARLFVVLALALHAFGLFMGAAWAETIPASESSEKNCGFSNYSRPLDCSTLGTAYAGIDAFCHEWQDMAAYEAFHQVSEQINATQNYYKIDCRNTTRPPGVNAGWEGGFFWVKTMYSCPAGGWQLSAQHLCTRPDGPDICRAPLDGEQTPHPITPATGEKVRQETDWSDGGAAPLALVRTYRSSWSGREGSGDIGLGEAWTHNFSERLTRRPSSNRATVTITSSQGYHRTFIQNPSTSAWDPTSGSADALTETDSHWIYRRAADDAVLTFDRDGRLQQRAERGGFSYTYAYDSAGRLSSVNNGFGRALTFHYNSAGQLQSVTTPDARSIIYGHDASGRLASVTYPDGRSRAFVYENINFPQALTGIVDESGVRWATFTYDTDGRAIESQLAGGASRYQVSYHGTAAATVTDPLQTQRRYGYSANAGNLTVINAPLPSAQGHADASTRVQDDYGLTTSETDFKNVRTDYVWDIARRLPLSVTEAVGTAQQRVTTLQWHPQWSLPVRVEVPGSVTTYAYDNLGRLISRAVSDTTAAPSVTRTWGWTYNGQGLVATATEPNAGATRYTYDTRGNVLTVTDPMDRVTAYAYDSANQVISKTGPNGLAVAYAWDARGRLLSQTVGAGTPDALTTTLTYHPTGMLKSMALPSGRVTHYLYDAAQRLSGWNDNVGQSGSFVLDGMGNRVREQVLNADGSMAYRVARLVNYMNRVENVTEGGSVSRSYMVDANGERISEEDGFGRATKYGLDALRRVQTLTNAQNAQNAQASLTYNAQDAITQASDFKGVVTSYTRDALGNAKQESSADSGTLTRTYDSLGLPQSLTDALGRATAITRDALGRPTQIVSSLGGASRTTVLRYDLPGPEYNASGAPSASVGSLSEIQDAGVTTRYQRDAQGRITARTQVLANGNGGSNTSSTLGYSYVPAGSAGAGQIARITYPSGRQLVHQYDATGQLTRLQWNGQPLVSGITWSPLGQATGWQWPGFVQTPGNPAPLVEQRSYTSAGQLAASALLQLTWDSAGRIAQITQQHMLPTQSSTVAQQVALTSAYSYDATGRLTASAHSAPNPLTLPSGTTLSDTIGANASGYAWDANGNRSQSYYSSSTAGGTARLQRDYQIASNSNRLGGYTQTFTPAGGSAQTTNVSYIHDATGSITRKGDSYLHYGVDGRIAKAGPNADPASALAVSYTYNALGQRVFKSDARLSGANNPAITQQTVYAEDGIGSTVLGQYGSRRSSDSAAAAGEMDSTEVIYLPTAAGPMPIAAQINGRLYAIDADHLNTPRRLTNTQGQVAWQWLITGFGEANPTTGATGYAQSGQGSAAYAEAIKFDLRYPGQVLDEETGLNYNLNRSYDPPSGRYFQSDPIGLEGGWNRFAYVSGNPLAWADPKGLAIPAVVIACMSNPLCATAAGGVAVAAINACKQTFDYLSPRFTNWSLSTSNPMTGEPGCEVECKNKSGNRKQTRRYGPDGFPETDTDWDHSHGGIGSPHSHDWSRPSDGSRPTHGNRGEGRPSVPGDPGLVK